MQKQIILLASIASVALGAVIPATSFTANTNVSNVMNSETFEIQVLNAIRAIDSSVPAAIRSRLTMHNIDVVLPPQSAGPISNPYALAIRRLDQDTEIVYSASNGRSTTGQFHISSWDLIVGHPTWLPWTYPDDLRGLGYSAALARLRRVTGATDFVYCIVGRTPLDPFNPRVVQVPTSVLWLCLSRSVPAGSHFWALKVDNGAVGHFDWADVGIQPVGPPESASGNLASQRNITAS